MSGGHYDYACYMFGDFVEEFKKNLNNDPLRIAFCEHLEKIGKAMHDIEWVDSGDYGAGDEHESIKACLLPTGLDETVKHNLRIMAQKLAQIADPV